jgi:polyisoprenyl-teichoic acid--peptidoglycan teichoic acid transferase
MQLPHETAPRRRSGFVAAFLSLLFPGLGHAYLGAYRRGLGWAAPPFLLLALAAGFAIRLNVFDLAGLAIQSTFLDGLFIVNLIALAYRAAAIVDAWAIARRLGASPLRGSGPALGTTAMLSVAGLAGVLLVMSVAHVAVARYDLLLSGTLNCVFSDASGDCGPTATDRPGGTGSPGDSGPGASLPSTVGPPIQTTAPETTWDGKSRLNILLVGADEQDGGHNTDTMITVSIDPATHQVVMFTLPRDTVDVPIPPGPARNVFGATYSGKINSWWAAVHNRPDFYPAIPNVNGGPGYNGLKAILGNLYGLDIRYFVEVNFEGFKKVVDALGGVTINVQIPVVDDHFPGAGGELQRLYIPAGLQHMTGAEALHYARSRHTSSDFDRGARQQRVLVSLREQTNIQTILPSVNALMDALKSSVRTDIPRALVPQLLQVADGIDARAIRSVLFTPPYYQTESSDQRGYIILPNISRIRQAVRDAFKVDPGLAEARDAVAAEGAEVWVLNGTNRTGLAANLAAYLDYLGVAATAPNQRPDTRGLNGTTIRAYNGAETTFPLTVAMLQDALGVTVVPISDPAVHVDFIVITGAATPLLTPPPAP